ncbi:MarR family winged helix-turn-helix transcriptional regulator [Rhodoligotrophos appendicifer]|uniref:MarR family winged helix-turn-helix transcriptional regulator n=1 Tax=Rhodoligotrophos appendicifer TaxID=987056 RepID=UPI001185752C|nr:MarR family transcriptional regulator [Rhodoligotrophos appendicifer]
MTSDPLSLRGRLGSQVWQTARQWRRSVDRRLHPFGLTEATWLPLLKLSRAAAPLRQKDLASALCLDSSSVVRLLDSLEAAGLVIRQEEDGDRRAKVIMLTEQGRSTVDQVEAVAREVRDEALLGLSDADVVTALHVLDHVHSRLAASEPGSTDGD